jgi:cytochrome bd-type quinol oxidase subunit 2
VIDVYALIYLPIVLFVAAFLYETFLSFMRIKYPKKNIYTYVDATWEITNTLLVFGVVMLIMLFTQSLDVLAPMIFLSTLLAGLALIIRAACYIYIFYVKNDPRSIGVVDWLFALSHVVAALLLVVTVIQATLFLFTKHPVANDQFVPYFIPGLVVVMGLCIVPIARLYRTRVR